MRIYFLSHIFLKWFVVASLIWGFFLLLKTCTFNFFAFKNYLIDIQLTNHKIHPLKVFNSVCFSIFTKSRNLYHYPIPERFHHSQKKTIYISSHSPFSPSCPSPWQLVIYFPSLEIFCSMYPYFNPFYGWKIFCRMDVPLLSVHSSINGYVGCFHFFGYHEQCYDYSCTNFGWDICFRPT